MEKNSEATPESGEYEHKKQTKKRKATDTVQSDTDIVSHVFDYFISENKYLSLGTILCAPFYVSVNVNCMRHFCFSNCGNPQTRARE